MSAQPQPPDRNLAMELVRVTEAAALASARWMGRGDKEGADGAATEDDPVEGVLRRVYADVSPSVWPAARLSIRAQLEYLAH